MNNVHPLGLSMTVDVSLTRIRRTKDRLDLYVCVRDVIDVLGYLSSFIKNLGHSERLKTVVNGCVLLEHCRSQCMRMRWMRACVCVCVCVSSMSCLRCLSEIQATTRLALWKRPTLHVTTTWLLFCWLLIWKHEKWVSTARCLAVLYRSLRIGFIFDSRLKEILALKTNNKLERIRH